MEDSKLKVARIVTAAVCAVILIYSVTQMSLSKLDPWRTLGLVAILAFFEAWHIRYPWGRPVRLGIAVALCVMAIRPVPEALVIFFIGSIIGRLIPSRTSRISSGDFYYIFQRTIILALAGVVFALISQFHWHQVLDRMGLGQLDKLWNQYPGPDHYGSIPDTYCNPVVMYRALMFPLAYLCMAVVYYAGEMISSSIETGLVKSGSWRVILPHQVRQTYPVYLALVASGGLMAFYFPRLPWFNFLIFFLPLMLVRAECNRDKALDQRFFDTMRIIGDAVDQDRGVPGHSSRVSNLSVEVARSMGQPEDAVRDLRYAAVLHDVGFISAGVRRRRRPPRPGGGGGAGLHPPLPQGGRDRPLLPPRAPLRRGRRGAQGARGVQGHQRGQRLRPPGQPGGEAADPGRGPAGTVAGARAPLRLGGPAHPRAGPGEAPRRRVPRRAPA